MKPLLDRRHWVFDLDGTLTVAVHDFDGLRDELGIARGVGLLEHLRAVGPVRARAIEARIEAWELDHAERAAAEADAVALLEHLTARGARVGVLTRNTRPCAWRTLEVAGLVRFFEPDLCVGRHEAAPKPSGEGVERLLALWGAAPADAVMVGDWVYDVQAGRAAGVATVLVDRDGRVGEGSGADVRVRSLRELLP